MKPFIIANAVITLALAGALVGVTVAEHGAIDSQASHAQSSISKLQQENASLATQLAQAQTAISANRTALAKVPDQANVSKLGICYQTSSQTFTGLVDSIMNNYAFIDGLYLSTPNNLNGVITCPSGYTYVPVTPANNSTNSN
jgi:hypothetical protein